jgi:hypothetical protein
MNKKIKGYGEVALVKYIDSDENGVICEGFFIESEEKGTLIKVEVMEK